MLYVYSWYMCAMHGVYLQVRGQLLGVSFPLLSWVTGVELNLPCLHSRCFYLLKHLKGPTLTSSKYSEYFELFNP